MATGERGGTWVAAIEWLMHRYDAKIHLVAEQLAWRMPIEDAAAEIRARLLKALCGYRWNRRYRKLGIRSLIDRIAMNWSQDLQAMARRRSESSEYAKEVELGPDDADAHPALAATEHGYDAAMVRQALLDCSEDARIIARILMDEADRKTAPRPWEIVKALNENLADGDEPWAKPRVEAALNELRGLLSAFR